MKAKIISSNKDLKTNSIIDNTFEKISDWSVTDGILKSVNTLDNNKFLKLSKISGDKNGSYASTKFKITEFQKDQLFTLSFNYISSSEDDNFKVEVIHIETGAKADIYNPIIKGTQNIFETFVELKYSGEYKLNIIVNNNSVDAFDISMDNVNLEKFKNQVVADSNSDDDCGNIIYSWDDNKKGHYKINNGVTGNKLEDPELWAKVKSWVDNGISTGVKNSLGTTETGVGDGFIYVGASALHDSAGVNLTNDIPFEFSYTQTSFTIPALKYFYMRIADTDNGKVLIDDVKDHGHYLKTGDSLNVFLNTAYFSGNDGSGSTAYMINNVGAASQNINAKDVTGTTAIESRPQSMMINAFIKRFSSKSLSNFITQTSTDDDCGEIVYSFDEEKKNCLPVANGIHENKLLYPDLYEKVKSWVDKGMSTGLKAAGENTWNTGQFLTEENDNYSLVVYKDAFYMLGSGLNNHKDLLKYNLRSNELTTISQHPISSAGIYGQSAVVYNDKMYVLGGLSGVDRVADFYVYDFNDNTWTALINDYGVCFYHGAVVVENKMYVSGGSKSVDTASNTLYAYDLDNNTWEVLENIPVNVCTHRMIEHDGTLYVFGGHNYTNYFSVIYKYNIENNTWTTSSTTIPLTLGEMSCVKYVNNKVYLSGGRSGSTLSPIYNENTYEFDLGTEQIQTIHTWTGLEQRFVRGVEYKGKIIVPCGGTSLGGNKDLFVFTPDGYLVDDGDVAINDDFGNSISLGSLVNPLCFDFAYDENTFTVPALKFFYARISDDGQGGKVLKDIVGPHSHYLTGPDSNYANLGTGNGLNGWDVAAAFANNGEYKLTTARNHYGIGPENRPQTIMIYTHMKSQNTKRVSVVEIPKLTLKNFAPEVIQHFGNRNSIINGDMRINQRGLDEYEVNNEWKIFTVDRFFSCGVGSNFTLGEIKSSQMINDNKFPVEFENYLSYNYDGAPFVKESNASFSMIHIIEGYNISKFKGKNITFSFYCSTSVAGKYEILFSNDYSKTTFRRYITTFTIDKANISQYITITLPFDTELSNWSFNEEFGMSIQISFAKGSDRKTISTENNWLSYTGNVIENQSLISTEDNLVSGTPFTFETTGWQLEAGDIATPFEHSPYDEELRRCMRYYEIMNETSYYPSSKIRSNWHHTFIPFLAVKRTKNYTMTFSNSGFANTETEFDVTTLTMNEYVGGVAPFWWNRTPQGFNYAYQFIHTYEGGAIRCSWICDCEL